MSRAATQTGTVPFGEYKTWYRTAGKLRDGKPAVVVLHGGPGSTHDYLLSLSAFAEKGWPVVLYDQIGNGGSTHLRDRGADFWTVQLFLDELDNLLTCLGIADDYVLLGHSWGGMLAAKYAAGRAPGLRGLVIANSPASYPLWLQAAKRLREQLPPGVNEVLLRHETARTTDSEEYVAAVRVFYERHLCRLQPWPRDYMASFYEVYNDPTVYFTMNGPSDFHVIGTLRDWSVEDCCPAITVPTLLISGRYDEATEETVEPFRRLIPDVRWELFEHSSHAPHAEEPERFRQVVLEFLDRLPDTR